MLHSNELCCTLSELRCALISRNKCICSCPNSGCQAHISLHCTTETYIEKPLAKNHSMGPSVRPNFFLFYSFFINIMSPAPPIASALIPTALLLIEKPHESSILAKNPPTYTTAYIVQQSNCRWHREPTFIYRRPTLYPWEIAVDLLKSL
jgi:hypothetical protein